MVARLGLAAIMVTLATLPASANRPAEAGINPMPIHCVAVFELMSRTAPGWMNQIDVQIARRSWQIEAGQSARQVNGDMGAAINTALEAIADQTESQSRALTALASQCVADAPL